MYLDKMNNTNPIDRNIVESGVNTTNQPSNQAIPFLWNKIELNLLIGVLAYSGE
jgi:hypothetical protein